MVFLCHYLSPTTTIRLTPIKKPTITTPNPKTFIKTPIYCIRSWDALSVWFSGGDQYLPKWQVRKRWASQRLSISFNCWDLKFVDEICSSDDTNKLTLTTMKSQHLQTDSKQNPWLGWLVWVTTVAWVARLVGCGRWLGGCLFLVLAG